MSAIEEILKSYKSLLNEKNNVVEGVAITAIAMTTNEIKELEAKLSSRYNKNVTLENKVDESVLGGVLVRLGNEEIDGTVKNRLDKMKEQLSQVIS
jgi:F-type H+-transporting ATPase subunit delta